MVKKSEKKDKSNKRPKKVTTQPKTESIVSESRMTESKKIKFNLPKFWPIILVGIICLMMVIIMVGQKYIAKNMADKPEQEKNSQSTSQSQSAEKEMAHYTYEIKYIDRNHNPMYVQVYTTAKSDKQLIELNDKLLPKYNKLKRNVLIAYFDDPKIAQSYFQQKGIDNKTQTTHFIASMLYIDKKDPKTKAASSLIRLSAGTKILKTY